MDPKCYHVCWPRLTPERVARVCQHHPSFLLQLDLPLLSSRPTGCHTLVLCLQTAVYNIIKPLSPPDRLAKTLPPIVYDNLPIIYYILWSVYYLTGVPANMTDDSLLEAASRTVQQVFADENFTDFQSRWTFIATWHNVFNYGSTSQNSVGVIVSVKNDMRPMAYICLSVCQTGARSSNSYVKLVALRWMIYALYVSDLSQILLYMYALKLCTRSIKTWEKAEQTYQPHVKIKRNSILMNRTGTRLFERRNPSKNDIQLEKVEDERRKIY